MSCDGRESIVFEYSVRMPFPALLQYVYVCRIQIFVGIGTLCIYNLYLTINLVRAKLITIKMYSRPETWLNIYLVTPSYCVCEVCLKSILHITFPLWEVSSILHSPNSFYPSQAAPNLLNSHKTFGQADVVSALSLFGQKSADWICLCST